MHAGQWLNLPQASAWQPERRCVTLGCGCDCSRVYASAAVTSKRRRLHRARQVAARGRQLCLSLRQLREKELREALLLQWRQTMTAPDWCVHSVCCCCAYVSGLGPRAHELVLLVGMWMTTSGAPLSCRA